MAGKLVTLYRKYPARINGAVASALVALALRLHIVLDQASVLDVVTTVAAILGLSEVTHRKVTPTAVAEGDVE